MLKIIVVFLLSLYAALLIWLSGRHVRCVALSFAYFQRNYKMQVVNLNKLVPYLFCVSLKVDLGILI